MFSIERNKYTDCEVNGEDYIIFFMSRKTLKLIRVRNIAVVLSLVIFSFGMGLNIGAKQAQNNPFLLPVLDISGKTSEKVTGVNFSQFWEVWDRLNRYYIDKKAIDARKMVYGAISGMVGALGDPYTIFLPPEQNKEAKDDLSGKLEGIGVQLGVKEKRIIVIAPLKGTPAEKAGMRAGDFIQKVDGVDTADWTLPYAVSKIRGPKGTSVKLTVYHKNATASSELNVIRDSIQVASVEWNIRNFRCNNSNSNCKGEKEECPGCIKLVYLKLSRFGDQTTEEWIKNINAIKEMTDKDGSIKGMIFDLRNNPGGYLTGSVFIASEFLKDGVVVIQENVKTGRQNYNVNRKGKLYDIPLVVLANKGTASAGEIVAGALKERNRAKLVGETTFGKGSIQEAQELSDGAGIHITTSKWLLPSGKWINSTGVEPDIKIENNIDKPDEDLQLEKAAETLLK